MRHFYEMDAKPSPLFVAVGLFFKFKPLIFAFGIMMPFIAQALTVSRAPLPEAVSPWAVGFGVAALWGGIAQWKGRWV
jgi:hypothetical protein